MRISTPTLTILALSFATSADAASLKSSAGTSHKDKNELIPLQNAGRKLSRAATSVISAFQKSSIPEQSRFLETDPDDTCVGDTFVQLFNITDGPFENVLGDEDAMSNCNLETLTCDLSSTTDAAKTRCDAFGGKIVTNEILFCEEDAYPAGSGLGGDLLLENVPVCVAKSCGDDTKLTDLFSAFSDAYFENVESFNTLSREKCNSGASSGAGVAKTFGQFILASVAGAVALFTV